MKPPKSLRNIVHTILGTKKQRSKSVGKTTSLIDPEPLNSHDKNSRQHRSAEDLLDSNYDRQPKRHESFQAGTRSLPRRSKSCLSGERPRVSKRESIYGPKVVGADDFDYEFQQTNRNDSDRRTVRESGASSRTSSKISRSKSLHSLEKNHEPKRTQSYNTGRILEFDEGYGDSLPRTTSWSHERCEDRRTQSCDQVIEPRGASRGQFCEDERIRSTGSKLSHVSNRSSNTLGRFASHEHLLDQPRLKSSSSRNTLTSDRTFRTASRTSTESSSEDKLRTCLDVLNRLSAQVKEIKDVSKRVRDVDKNIKVTSMQPGERERRLRELDMAEAASRRLKSMLKSSTSEVSQGRLNSSSSSSSGYSSASASRRNSAFSGQEQIERTSRPPSRKSQDPMGFGYSMDQYPTSEPYPQSVSDMMTIWDAKEEAMRTKPRGRLVTKDDSMSSGYATGSGSEDGRRDSLAVTPENQMMSNYHANEQWHKGQVYNPAFNGYDPYAIYGNYHHSMSVDSAMAPSAENIYGNYGELFGYASSSLYDNEVYSNGWYRIQAPTHIPPHHCTNMQPPNQVHDPIYQHHNQLFHQGWSQPSFVPPQMDPKYGGLSDMFYDPSAKPAPSVIDNVTEDLERDSKMSEESNWKTYGSFRYKNGEKMVQSVSAASRKRKTVRFSQTVRQRVETEESEMEDSTSVIKGCEGDDKDHREDVTSGNNTNQEEQSDIYMWPRAQEELTNIQQNSTHKVLHEPIYEFPSGHIESSCMCGDCILARGSCQMQPTHIGAYYQ